MQVNIKGGARTVKMTEREKKTLLDAQELCINLAMLNPEGEHESNAHRALRGVILTYCDPEEGGDE